MSTRQDGDDTAGVTPEPGGVMGPYPGITGAGAPAEGGPEAGAAPGAGPGGVPEERIPRTRTSAVWTTAGFGLAFLVVVLIFILDNLQRVKVSFVGASGSLPLAVALLFAAILGALVVLLMGAARVLQ
ncbi:MAG: LapA family protein, partial [Acidimicrobiales bacterium]